MSDKLQKRYDNADLLVCEECNKILKRSELLQDDKWGHICKLKNYRTEHRCESYITDYHEESNQ